MNMLRRFLLVALLVSFSSCAYSKIVVPMDRDVNKTDLGTKIGKASTHEVAYLVAWGDSGVAAAAKNGELTTVKHLDMEVFTVAFGLYSKVTTVAYGD